MQTYDWDAIRQELEDAHAEGEGDWVIVTESAEGHGLTQRLREGRIPTLAGLDLEAQSRRVPSEVEPNATIVEVYARIKSCGDGSQRVTW